MTEYNVRLEQYISCRGRHPDSLGVIMYRLVTLPFVPTLEIGLGLIEDSDFESDCTELTQIMWQVPESRFLARLEDNDGTHGMDSIAWMLAHGWCVDLRCEWPDHESAVREAIGEAKTAVEIVDGPIHVLYPNELSALELTGLPHVILHRGDKVNRIIAQQ